MKSPLFEKALESFADSQTIVFDNKPVKAIAATDGGDWLYDLRFYDAAGTERAAYNPNHYDRNRTKHVIGEDEELIGIYGHLGNHS